MQEVTFYYYDRDTCAGLNFPRRHGGDRAGRIVRWGSRTRISEDMSAVIHQVLDQCVFSTPGPW